VLGIDLGARRIGLAVGDTGTGQVRPLATLHRSEPDRDAAVLRRICAEQAVTDVVVGLPLLADGSEGTQAAITRDWAARVEPFLGLPLGWRDERHTSQAAERRLGTMHRGHGGGAPSAAARSHYRARVDREAAAWIVQAELDARSGQAASR